MSHIIDSLYLGDKYSVETFFKQEECGIVVNCTYNIPMFYNHTNSIQQYRVTVKDNLCDEECVHLYKALENETLFEIIEHAMSIKKEKVLIHCRAGSQRSAAVVACFLIWKYGLDVFDAIKFIKDKRPVAFSGGVNFLTTIKHFSKTF